MSNSKEEKTIRVAAAALSIISQQGIKAATPSRVARSAGVSRPWIYKYIGGDPEDLIRCGVDYFGKVYSRLEENFADSSPEAWVADEIQAFRHTLDVHQKFPWIIPLYYRFKASPTPMGKAIDKIESAYLVKKQKQLKKAVGLSDGEAKRWAEFTTAFKLSLVHRCQFGNLREFMSSEDICEGIGFTLKAMANERIRQRAAKAAK